MATTTRWAELLAVVLDLQGQVVRVGVGVDGGDMAAMLSGTISL